MKNPFLENFHPYIPDKAHLRELTPLPLIIGTLLGIIFGASSLYLVLKVGLTVSASIPVAVIAITVFRLLSKMGMRDATILEANVAPFWRVPWLVPIWLRALVSPRHQPAKPLGEDTQPATTDVDCRTLNWMLPEAPSKPSTAIW